MTAAGVFLVASALLAANLPFLSERLFLAVPLKGGRKAAYWRVIELAVYYLLVAALAYLLEARGGPVHAQGWEFYAVTVSLFLVFAYPGFVYRFLWKRPGRSVEPPPGPDAGA